MTSKDQFSLLNDRLDDLNRNVRDVCVVMAEVLDNCGEAMRVVRGLEDMVRGLDGRIVNLINQINASVEEREDWSTDYEDEDDT